MAPLEDRDKDLKKEKKKSMFWRYQPREMQVSKEKSKSNKGICKTMRCHVSLFQPWLHDKPQKADRILQQACLVSMWVFYRKDAGKNFHSDYYEIN